jgi:hypothetical protein
LFREQHSLGQAITYSCIFRLKTPVLSTNDALRLTRIKEFHESDKYKQCFALDSLRLLNGGVNKQIKRQKISRKFLSEPDGNLYFFPFMTAVSAGYSGYLLNERFGRPSPSGMYIFKVKQNSVE